MKRLYKEPLLHFLIIGAVIFVLFSIVNKDENCQDSEGGEIDPPGTRLYLTCLVHTLNLKHQITNDKKQININEQKIKYRK